MSRPFKRLPQYPHFSVSFKKKVKLKIYIFDIPSEKKSKFEQIQKPQKKKHSKA